MPSQRSMNTSGAAGVRPRRARSWPMATIGTTPRPARPHRLPEQAALNGDQGVHVSTNFGRPFFGLHLPNYTYPGVPDEQLFGRVIEQAQAAEAAGFELVTVMDHFYQIRGVGPEEGPM